VTKLHLIADIQLKPLVPLVGRNSVKQLKVIKTNNTKLHTTLMRDDGCFALSAITRPLCG
jgi:hypothetical protein